MGLRWSEVQILSPRYRTRRRVVPRTSFVKPVSGNRPRTRRIKGIRNGMSFNLEMFLVVATAATGVVTAVYRLRHGRRDPRDRHPWLVELSRSFFPVLLIVLVFRSFLFEPFRIPSGSMLPTLEIGDFILVKKFSYGLRLPVLHYSFLDTGKPERGDVVVFRFPDDPSQNFIKRLVGLPGDHIVYRDKRLRINGAAVGFTRLKHYEGSRDEGRTYAREHLPGAEHLVLLHDGAYARNGEWTVPDGHYFVMGDNRDNSNDSRAWRFVPENHLVGRASLVWMHWDWSGRGIDFSRLGRRII